MDKIQQFFQLLAAWKFWSSLFHDFIWLDWLLFAAVFAAVVTGVYRGIGFFLTKLIYLLVFTLTVMLAYPWIAEAAIRYLPFAQPGFWKPLCFLLSAAAIFFILKKIPFFKPQKARLNAPRLSERFTGSFAGFFLVMLGASVASNFLLTFPSKSITKLYSHRGARYGTVLKNFAPQTVDTLLMPIRMIVNRKPKHL